MTTIRLTIAVGMVAALAGQMSAWAQSSVIALEGNGQLSWTNGVNTNALYSVEWASKPGGPWHSFTYQPINTIDALTNTSFSVAVPMYYRVMMTTNQPPLGMIWIDGGDFVMGDSQGVGNPDERPIHTNFISGFWIDETEVPKTKWDEVYGWATNHDYQFSNVGMGKTNNHPVQSVNWYDCVKWCNARSEKEGLTPCYYVDASYSSLFRVGDMDISNNWVNWSANGYRLPTEAEWEKAARGGRQGHLFPWGGDTISHSQANYFSTNSLPYDISPTRGYHPAYTNGGFPYTSPVGSFPANGYGLHNMAGNVWEWCWDWFSTNYYSAAYQIDPHGPAYGRGRLGNLARVLRGGCWEKDFGANHARCSFRGDPPPNYVTNCIGFRCVR
jgi:formylglycine-generating enzyme